MHDIRAANIRRLRRPQTGHVSSGRRLKTDWPAVLRAGEATIPCRINDISSLGANLAVDGLPAGADTVVLLLDGMSAISASLVWRKKMRAGLLFTQEQNWVLDTCKRRFDASAWLRHPQGDRSR